MLFQSSPFLTSSSDFCQKDGSDPPNKENSGLKPEDPLSSFRIAFDVAVETIQQEDTTAKQMPDFVSQPPIPNSTIDNSSRPANYLELFHEAVVSTNPWTKIVCPIVCDGREYSLYVGDNVFNVDLTVFSPLSELCGAVTTSSPTIPAESLHLR